MTSIGTGQGSNPHFIPLEEKQKMIQFEMNLLARANKQQQAASANYQSTSLGHPGSTMNKATLCDSTNSK